MKFFLRWWKVKHKYIGLLEEPFCIYVQVEKRRILGLGNKLKERKHSKVLGLGS